MVGLEFSVLNDTLKIKNRSLGSYVVHLASVTKITEMSYSKENTRFEDSSLVYRIEIFTESGKSFILRANRAEHDALLRKHSEVRARYKKGGRVGS